MTAQQSTPSPVVTRVVNDQGRAFNVVLVRPGDRYGLNGVLCLGAADEPMIEFYDATYENDARFDKGRGQFVTRYYLSALTERTPRTLHLCGHEPAWKVSGQNVIDAVAAVKAVLHAKDHVKAHVYTAHENRERAMFGCTIASIDEALAGKEPRDIAMYAMGTLSNAQELILHNDNGSWSCVADRDVNTLRQLINVAKYAMDKAVPR